MRIYILLVAISLAAANSVFAQNKKFERPGAKKVGTAAGAPAAAPAADKKIDISDLENRYWTEKDKEFSVVQNRIYTKAHKFSVAPSFGTIINDPFTTTLNYGLTANYYFNEREGVGMDLWMTSSTVAEFVPRIASLGGAPDHNIAKGYLGFNYQWIPIYAKMSLLEKKIIYFDMGISPGLGATWMRSAAYGTTPPPTKDQYALTLAVDVFQQFFLAEKFAVRLDLKNHLYPETIYGGVSGTQLSTKMTYNCSVLFGFTYFFSGPIKEEVKAK